MTPSDNSQKSAQGSIIDLQGVASFASLVELLAQELGTTAGKMQGTLPDGPQSFNKLTGEIDLNNQGFMRKLILLAEPGAPLTLRFQCAWNPGKGNTTEPLGVTADYYLGVAVEQIVPQGRALARYVEDIFAVMDRMVTLGQSSRLSAMNIPASQIEAFEQSESGNLVSTYTPKNSST